MGKLTRFIAILAVLIVLSLVTSLINNDFTLPETGLTINPETILQFVTLVSTLVVLMIIPLGLQWLRKRGEKPNQPPQKPSPTPMNQTQTEPKPLTLNYEAVYLGGHPSYQGQLKTHFQPLPNFINIPEMMIQIPYNRVTSSTSTTTGTNQPTSTIRGTQIYGAKNPLRIEYIDAGGVKQSLLFEIDKRAEVESIVNTRISEWRKKAPAPAQPRIDVTNQSRTVNNTVKPTQTPRPPIEKKQSTPSRLIMDRYVKLKQNASKSPESSREYQAFVEKMRYRDSTGRIWTIGKETGRWYYFEGRKFKEGTPPNTLVEA